MNKEDLLDFVYKNIKRWKNEFSDVSLILDAKIPLVRFYDKIINKRIDIVYGSDGRNELW